jgi:hypothetical protein
VGVKVSVHDLVMIPIGENRTSCGGGEEDG